MGLPCGTLNENYSQDMAIVRTRLQWGLLACFLVFLFLLPLFGSTLLVNMIILVSVQVIAVHGLNILTGYCGQISLGHAAFLAVGAYTSAILTTKLGLSYWLALPCAGLNAAIIGMFFGLPAVRIKGLYLALATVAAQFIIIYVITVARPLTGGIDGIHTPPPQIGNITLDSAQSYYYLAVILAIIATIMAKNIVRTRAGRAFIAIRDNDIAAEVMGINLFRYKLFAFFIASFFAGIAGSLWVHNFGYTHPDQFPLIDSVWYLGMIIVGGMGSTAGAIFGVIFLRLLGELVTVMAPTLASLIPAISTTVAAALGPVVYGVVIILFLVFEPRGLAHRWEIAKANYRFWPFSYSFTAG